MKETSSTFNIYYNPKVTTYEIFLWIEEVAFNEARDKQYKLFQSIKTKDIGTLMIGKN